MNTTEWIDVFKNLSNFPKEDSKGKCLVYTGWKDEYGIPGTLKYVETGKKKLVYFATEHKGYDTNEQYHYEGVKFVDIDEWKKTNDFEGNLQLIDLKGCKDVGNFDYDEKNNKLLCSCCDGGIRIINTKKNKVELHHEISSSEGLVSSKFFNFGKSVLSSVKKSNEIIDFGIAKKKEKRKFVEEDAKSVYEIGCLEGNNKIFIACCEGNNNSSFIQIFSTKSKRRISRINGYGKDFQFLDDKNLVFCSDGLVSHYDLRKIEDPVSQSQGKNIDYRGGIRGIYFSNNGLGVAVDIYGGITIYNTKDLSKPVGQFTTQYGSGQMGISCKKNMGIVCIPYVNPQSAWNGTCLVVYDFRDVVDEEIKDLNKCNVM